MIKETLIAISLITNISLTSLGVTPSAQLTQQHQTVLATQTLDLTNRLPGEFGNQVFADNILLNLHYIKGDVEELRMSNEILNQVQNDKQSRISGPGDIDWKKVREPFEVSFALKPGEVFAFHENVLPEYKNIVNITSNSHFDFANGYKSLNGLSGNGVCHLASLINWVAKEADLESKSMVNHDFSPVPGVPREYGASIYYSPSGGLNTESQNLYIKNNFDYPVKFEFKADSKEVNLTIVK